MRVLIIGVFLLVSFRLGAESPVQNSLSVCELLAHLDRYRGKDLEVRGELRTGEEEMAIYGENCAKMIITDNHRWPNAIWLTPPGGTTEISVDFKLDEASMRALRESIVNARAAGKQGKVLATFVGRFEARSRLIGSAGPNRRWIGNGFGHQNAYPAQLIYKSVRQVIVADR